jgi:hypothetical protein
MSNSGLPGSLDYQNIPSGPVMQETGTFASRVLGKVWPGRGTGKPGKPGRLATLNGGKSNSLRILSL